jgi:hypothetical protein
VDGVLDLLGLLYELHHRVQVEAERVGFGRLAVHGVPPFWAVVETGYVIQLGDATRWLDPVQ